LRWFATAALLALVLLIAGTSAAQARSDLDARVAHLYTHTLLNQNTNGGV
jgi:hypothetical protein